MAILGTFQSLLAPKGVSDPARSSEAAVPDSDEQVKGPDMIAMRDAFVSEPKKDSGLKDLEKRSTHAEFRAPSMFRKS